MLNPVPARYQDAGGVRHEVIVHKTPDGAWQVLDVSVTEAKLIENLTGSDGRPEAKAIAAEYAREQQAASEEAAAPARCS